MSNILVTAIGSFSADIVINNLMNEGHKIIGCDIYDKEWVANSLFVDQFYQSPLASKQSDYIEFILNVCRIEHVEYIIPLTDFPFSPYLYIGNETDFLLFPLF